MRETEEILPYAFADGKVYPVKIRFCAVRAMSMRSGEDCVLIKAPYATSHRTIKIFLQKHEKWLRARMEENKNSVDGVYLLGKKYPVAVSQGKNGVAYLPDRIEVTVKNGAEQEAKALLKKDYKKRAQAYLVKKAEDFFIKAATAVGLATMPKIIVRYCTSYWGKCFYTRNEIRFNAYLYGADEGVVDYVIAHEYAHFLVHDHSKTFYAALEKLLPGYAEARKRKKNYPCRSWFDRS